jgi:cytochrome c551/c552
MRYWKIGGIAGLVLLVGVPVAARCQAPAKPPAMTHDVAGKEKCLTCHAVGIMPAVKDVPASHKDRGEQTCAWCHAKDAAMQTKDAPVIAHALQGRAACLMCHKAGVMPAVPDVPADHAGRTDKDCQLCHHPKAA